MGAYRDRHVNWADAIPDAVLLGMCVLFFAFDIDSTNALVSVDKVKEARALLEQFLAELSNGFVDAISQNAAYREKYEAILRSYAVDVLTAGLNDSVAAREFLRYNDYVSVDFSQVRRLFKDGFNQSKKLIQEIDAQVERSQNNCDDDDTPSTPPLPDCAAPDISASSASSTLSNAIISSPSANIMPKRPRKLDRWQKLVRRLNRIYARLSQVPWIARLIQHQDLLLGALVLFILFRAFMRQSPSSLSSTEPWYRSVVLSKIVKTLAAAFNLHAL
jgi:hypothetical protein